MKHVKKDTAKSKIIGIDLDDVLMDFNEHFLAFLNTKYGTKHRREDAYDFNYEKVWGESKEVVEAKLLDFYHSQEHATARPFPGAVDGVRALKEAGHKLHIITSKPDMLRDTTDVWVERHFPGVFAEIHFMNHFHSTGKKLSKAEACTNLGVDIFIDDAIHNALNVATLGIPVLLLDAPWNQEQVELPIQRMKSWKEIVEFVRKEV